jgi:regulator of sirC expression with transglutaminase-like and TPR domain
MNWSWSTSPTPLVYFASLVREDAAFPLLEATAALAMDEYPELDVQQVLSEVDHLLGRLRRRLAADAGPMQRLQLLNHFFFQELGFGGNVNHYYDPDNSYLNQVLERRRGIPISLAILWLELAQGIGLHAQGVNFPGHYMIKVSVPQGQVVLDPFTGQSLGREDLSERLDPYKKRNGLVDDFDVPVELYLQAAEPRQTLVRVLRNLKEIHRTQQDWARLLSVQERLVVLLPNDPTEKRDRGLVWAELGQPDKALDDLEAYLAQAEDPTDASVLQPLLTELRNRLGQ